MSKAIGMIEFKTTATGKMCIRDRNKDGVNCHNCGGACHSQDYKQFPGYQYDFVGSETKAEAPAATGAADAELVANITKQVMAQLGMK